ncbi:MAG: hypothetical protein K0U18_01235 [Betaproteobacteria bacterium]|nr:hypothetical protein [Betaproteobacteria bacterium]MCH9848510.1 hypothetical protein [Betaproteobacteria bacterium]
MTEEDTSLEKTQEIGIQQLNLSYDKLQDRLLFRVGLSDESEIALWLTYRFSRQLWAELNQEAHLPEAKSFASDEIVDAVSQFQQEVEATEALKKMDFATDYQPREKLRTDGQLLAVSFTLSEDAKHLEVTCLEEIAVNFNLTPELILAICSMLQLAAKEANWEMTTAVPAIMMDESSVSKVLH